MSDSLVFFTFYINYEDCTQSKNFLVYEACILDCMHVFKCMHTAMHHCLYEHTAHACASFAWRETQLTLLIFTILSELNVMFSVNHIFLSSIHADVILCEAHSYSTCPRKDGGRWRINESWFLWRRIQEASAARIPRWSVIALPGSPKPVVSSDVPPQPCQMSSRAPSLTPAFMIFLLTC